jgi:hypothetical protein
MGSVWAFYLGAYQYRFNRRFDLAGMLFRLITAAARTGKRSEGWLRSAEDQCKSGIKMTP